MPRSRYICIYVFLFNPSLIPWCWIDLMTHSCPPIVKHHIISLKWALQLLFAISPVFPIRSPEFDEQLSDGKSPNSSDTGTHVWKGCIPFILFVYVVTVRKSHGTAIPTVCVMVATCCIWEDLAQYIGIVKQWQLQMICCMLNPQKQIRFKFNVYMWYIPSQPHSHVG